MSLPIARFVVKMLRLRTIFFFYVLELAGLEDGQIQSLIRGRGGPSRYFYHLRPPSTHFDATFLAYMAYHL